MRYQSTYDSIDIEDEIDGNTVLVVICLWRRIQYLPHTLRSLAGQSIEKTITLCLWNNNPDNKHEIEKAIRGFRSSKLHIIVHNSGRNVGGIGRFIFTKYVCERKRYFENVIFIDDDQVFGDDCIHILLSNVKRRQSYHWSGKIFYRNRGYWDSYSNVFPSLGDNVGPSSDKRHLDYGGTGFMIINTECFLMDEFYELNPRYAFIEDLWMSYFVTSKLGYKLQNGVELRNKVRIIRGENRSPVALVNSLRPLKDEFLRELREKYNWDV